MKKAVVGSLITALLAAGVAVAATTNVVSVNVVGFQKLEVAGSDRDIWTLMSIPMTKIPVYRGTITTGSGVTITDLSANWGSGQFALKAAGQETGLSTFYAEISDTNSALEGRHFYITTNSANSLTLASALPVPVDGFAYKIVPANRIRDIFGEPGAPLLFGSNILTAADNIFTWDTKWSEPIFYKNAGTPSTLRNHWVMGSNIVDDMVIDRDEGIAVKRLANKVSTNVTVAGEVSANAQAIVLEGGGMRQIIGGMSAVDTPIGSSGLQSVMKGSNILTQADNIYAWVTNAGKGKWSEPVFYKNSGTPSTLRNHWVMGSNIVDNTFILRAGEGYFIEKRFATNVWERTTPLQ